MQQSDATTALQAALVACYTQAPSYGLPTGGSSGYSAPTVGAPAPGGYSAPTVGAPAHGYSAPTVGAPAPGAYAPMVGAPGPTAYGAAYGSVGMPFGGGSPAYGGGYGGGGYDDSSRCQPILNELAAAEASSCAALEYVKDLVKLATRTAAKRAEVIEHCHGDRYGNDNRFGYGNNDFGFCQLLGGCGNGCRHRERCTHYHHGCDGHRGGDNKHNGGHGRSLYSY